MAQFLVATVDHFFLAICTKRHRKIQREYDRYFYKERNLIERFFNRIKHFRRIATRYEKTARNYLAMLTLAATVLWLA